MAARASTATPGCYNPNAIADLASGVERATPTANVAASLPRAGETGATKRAVRLRDSARGAMATGCAGTHGGPARCVLAVATYLRLSAPASYDACRVVCRGAGGGGAGRRDGGQDGNEGLSARAGSVHIMPVCHLRPADMATAVGSTIRASEAPSAGVLCPHGSPRRRHRKTCNRRGAAHRRPRAGAGYPVGYAHRRTEGRSETSSRLKRTVLHVSFGRASEHLPFWQCGRAARLLEPRVGRPRTAASRGCCDRVQGGVPRAHCKAGRGQGWSAIRTHRHAAKRGGRSGGLWSGARSLICARRLRARGRRGRGREGEQVAAPPRAVVRETVEGGRAPVLWLRRR